MAVCGAATIIGLEQGPHGRLDGDTKAVQSVFSWQTVTPILAIFINIFYTFKIDLVRLFKTAFAIKTTALAIFSNSI